MCGFESHQVRDALEISNGMIMVGFFFKLLTASGYSFNLTKGLMIGNMARVMLGVLLSTHSSLL